MSGAPPCPTCGLPVLDGVCRPCAFAAALSGLSTLSSDDHVAAATPDAPGGYELIKELGRGASAVVWLARDKKLERLVALKLIAAGTDARLVQRLVREGQAVARLRHPHIVVVHAMGATATEAFLAMDFIDGGDLRRRLGGRPLAPGEAAQLARKLADALAHAHAEGILHRDLKPSNVLLDAAGEPRLADFGLAAPLAGGGDLTLPGQVAGTPAYLAPELLTGAEHASPLSDLYSLGAVLYECLTGRAPFVGESAAAILGQIATVEPPPPRLLQPGIPRDLETICLKCLHKIPGRRYASAQGLADDLGRFLRGEPIAARPIGRGEKFVRWGRRNPGTAVLAGVAASLLLTLAIGGPLVALRLARARGIAASEAAASKAVSEFLQQDLLGQASPDNQPDREVKLRTVLDRAGKKIEGRFADQPQVEATLRQTLGGVYLSLGDYAATRIHYSRALEILRRQNGPEDPATLRLMSKLADLLRTTGQFAEADKLATETLELQQRTLGPEHPETVGTLNRLGIIRRYQGRFAEAQALYARALEIRRRISGPEHPQTLDVMNNLAVAYQMGGKLAEAETLQTETLQLRERVLGPEHPNTILSMNHLALIQKNAGRLAEAEVLCARALEIRRRVLGPEHPHTLLSMNTLATIYHDAAKFPEAGALYLQVIALQTRKVGGEHSDTLQTMSNLGALYLDDGRAAEAETLHAKVFAVRKRVLSPTHADTLNSMAYLARARQEQGKFAEADPLWAEVLAASEHTLGPAHRLAVQARDAIGASLLREGRGEEAIAMLRRALELRAKSAPAAWQTASTQSRLGECLLSLARYAEAEPLLQASHDALQRSAAKIPPWSRIEIARAAARLDQLYAKWDQPEKAREWRSRRAETVSASASK
ncbi:MAG: serine/threonine protein kinase [Opitutaceae bacterium]|nr:serine/threonine protein kinase [Opitutaceae bacterium]